MNQNPEATLVEPYDMVVIGGGPAGMSAALFAASEGMRVALLEAGAMLGGNARYSNRIENFLGFPHGLSGLDFASAGHAQLLRFGVHILLNNVVDTIYQDYSREIPHNFKVRSAYRGELQQANYLITKSIVAATGTVLNPSKIRIPGLETHPAVHFGETAMTVYPEQIAEEEVAVIGGGNSAGQAALWLAQYAKRVHVIIRGTDLNKSMSRYLVDRIEIAKNIAVWTEVEITLVSDTHVIMSDNISYAFDRLFFFTGSSPVAPPTKILSPAESWHEVLHQDGEGYIQTYNGFETNVPGLFAVGDIRSGATRRVAAAVGEGAAVVSQVHKYISK